MGPTPKSTGVRITFRAPACKCWRATLQRKERLMQAPGRERSTVRTDSFVDFVQQGIPRAENSAQPTVGDE